MKNRITSVDNLVQLRDSLQQDQQVFAKEGQIRVRICTGGGCIASGANDVFWAFAKELDHAGIDMFRCQTIKTGCLGPCSGGPALYIGDTFYSQVKPEDVPELIEEHILNRRVVERLLHQNADGQPAATQKEIDFFRGQKKAVLGHCGVIDPERIEDYITVDGYQALAKVLISMTPETVISEMKASGLRGRGGAGFLTGLKWELTQKVVSNEKYVVCNADEGDPGAFMDRSLLEGDPHSLIEGMAIAAFSLGAKQGYVYVRAEYPLAIERLQKAIDQARGCGLLGKNILGTGFDFDLEIRKGSGAFVCGEETALLTSIEGNRGEPRPRPPFPAQKGLWGKPTVLNNVETYANVAAIILKGGEWYASLSVGKSAGTKVFALAGDIVNSGLVEIPIGTPLGDVIYDIGGGIPNGKEFKAAQIGGPSGGCIPKEYLGVPLDYESLAELGAIIGSGGLIVMDEDSCMVDVARYFLEFVQEESCGKCVPCRVGTKRMLEILERICEGKGVEGDIERLIELGEMIKDTSLCGLGQTAPNPVLSTIRHFGHEYVEHIRDKTCRAGVCAALVSAPCESACPAFVDIPGFVSLTGEKRYSEALKLHRERNPFAAVCSRVCFHTCEDKCRRRSLDAPVSIRAVKRFLVDQEIVTQVPEMHENAANAAKKIAIIGAGPAGLSCAYFLARLGYKPKVFEAEQRPGGMLVQTIPAYRLPREIVAREVRMIERMGVEIQTGVSLGRDFSLQQLRQQGYDAVFLGMGAPDGVRIDIPGDDAEGVFDAMTFLRTYNMRGSAPVGNNVVVIGGGNSAFDAARTALRLGAESVTIVYRRTRDAMPAYNEEIEEAELEGVRLMLLTSPVEILQENGKVIGLKCLPMQLGEFDRSGRRRPKTGSNEPFVVPADQILTAIGQTIELGTVVDEKIDQQREFVRINPVNGATNVPWLFAGGDVVSGPSSVVEAIAAGERAAVGIDAHINGTANPFWRDIRPLDVKFDPDADPSMEPREKPNTIPVERRRYNFDEVELPWTEPIVVRQATRCLRCDYGKRCH